MPEVVCTGGMPYFCGCSGTAILVVKGVGRPVGVSVERFAISADGSGRLRTLEVLAAWFDEESELRGLIKPVAAVPDPGELGAISDTLLAAVGSGGAISVLAASLKAFFSRPRGAKVRLTVTRADGTRLELDADRVGRRSVPELARQLLAADVAER